MEFPISLQNDLDNYTWHEVQKRIREVQTEQQMCIHKEQLTELDIYHRILRLLLYENQFKCLYVCGCDNFIINLHLNEFIGLKIIWWL